MRKLERCSLLRARPESQSSHPTHSTCEAASSIGIAAVSCVVANEPIFDVDTHNYTTKPFSQLDCVWKSKTSLCLVCTDWTSCACVVHSRVLQEPSRSVSVFSRDMLERSDSRVHKITCFQPTFPRVQSNTFVLRGEHSKEQTEWILMMMLHLV